MITTNILPDKYRGPSDDEFKRRIAEAKKRLEERLTILGHYYQRDEVIEFADREGDSFTLAKVGSEASSEFIVFCGVHFMAEASVILARAGQRVFLPDMDAGCPMADMASIEDVEDAWGFLEKIGVAKDFVPIVYMNSTAELKAFCGKRGGTVCTSSSARPAFDWAIKQGKRILFFPDENLGINTARAHGIRSNEICTWNPEGMDEKALARSRVIVWNGYCHVHTYFTKAHMTAARAKYPDCKIIVHPECIPEVVELADGNGSTSFLKKYAEDAPEGSTVVIGTEINLVSRLARRHPEKRIVPLARSLCPNMFKVSLADLCWTLEEIGKVNEVFVDAGIQKDAKIALERMLKL